MASAIALLPAAKQGNYLSHVVGREALDDYAARHALPVDWNAPNAEELMAERAKEILNYSEQKSIRANFEGTSKAVNFEIHHLLERRHSGNLGIVDGPDKYWDKAPAITLPEKPGGPGGFTPADEAEFLAKLNNAEHIAAGGPVASMVYHKGDNGLVAAIDDIYVKMQIPNNSLPLPPLKQQQLIDRLCHMYTHDPRFQELNAWPAVRDHLLRMKKKQSLPWSVPDSVPFDSTWMAAIVP